MGSDSDSSSVKTIAPSDGLKLHVSHSLTVSMSTAIVVSACNSKCEDAREGIHCKLPSLASRSRCCFSSLRPDHAGRTCRNLGHCRHHQLYSSMNLDRGTRSRSISIHRDAHSYLTCREALLRVRITGPSTGTLLNSQLHCAFSCTVTLTALVLSLRC